MPFPDALVKLQVLACSVPGVQIYLIDWMQKSLLGAQTFTVWGCSHEAMHIAKQSWKLRQHQGAPPLVQEWQVWDRPTGRLALPHPATDFTTTG